MFISSKPDRFVCNQKVFDRRFDACRLVDSMSTDPFVSIIMNHLVGSLESGKFGWRCPWQKGRMLLQNVSYSGFLPFPSKTKFCCSVIFITRIEKSKNFVHGYTINTNFTYV